MKILKRPDSAKEALKDSDLNQEMKDEVWAFNKDISDYKVLGRKLGMIFND